MKKNTKKIVDWVGFWYTLNKKKGVDVTFTIIRKNLVLNQTESFCFSHERHDGAGALATWLRSKKYILPQLPTARPNDKPSFIKSPLILFKTLFIHKNIKPQRIPWKEKNIDYKNINNNFEYVLFYKKQIHKINNYCVQNKISQNAFLLSILHNELIPLLLKTDCSAKWLFPVNMRGNVFAKDDSQNLSSAIFISLKKQSTAAEIHKKIKTSLINKVHWSVWWLMHIGKIIGKKGCQYLSSQSQKNSFFYGSFSNMGSWPIKGSQLGPSFCKDDFYMGVPPGTANYPISVGLITWNHHLTLSLKIHPYILKDQSLTKTYLKNIELKIISVTGATL